MSMDNKIPENVNREFFAVGNVLMAVIETILRSVIDRAQAATIQITEKMQSLDHMSKEQASLVKDLISNLYNEETKEYKEIEKLTQETNGLVDEIFESAKSGNLEQAHKLGDDPNFKNLSEKASNLSRKLEALSESDKNFAESLMPIIIALQFQDSIRQSVEGVIKAFNCFFEEVQTRVTDRLTPDQFNSFWKKVESQFHTVEERQLIRESLKRKIGE